MTRNLANTKPPEFFKIGGKAYPVNFNYLIWIDILELLDEIDFDNIGEEELGIIEEIEILAFGRTIEENIFDVLRAVTGFAAGYPQPRNKKAETPVSPRRLFDFKIDLNSILIAIRDQSGIDLTRREEPFHWWLFLVEFSNLAGEHHIRNLMELRAYDGDDKDMKQARDAVALPPKVTRQQQKFNEEMDEIFYNC